MYMPQQLAQYSCTPTCLPTYLKNMGVETQTPTPPWKAYATLCGESAA